jgi:hypothetical protein
VTARSLAIVALLACTAACAPAITHGPRVEGGWQGGGLLAFGRSSLDARSEYPELLPSSVLFLRHGWAADSLQDEWGSQIGLQVTPIVILGAASASDERAELLRAVEIDGYLQVPGGHPRGIGVTVSRFVVMPYVQYGRYQESGQAWYTTQGFAFGSSGNYRLLFWAPSVALREVGYVRHNAVHLQLGGGFGISRQTSGVQWEDWEGVWLLSAGIGLELGGEREP